MVRRGKYYMVMITWHPETGLEVSWRCSPTFGWYGDPDHTPDRTDVCL